MRGWLARPVLAVAGASVGAAFVAALEGVRASREWYTPAPATALADAAVLVPVATLLAAFVAAAMMTLDPDRRWRIAYAIARLRSMTPEGRARAGAVALMTPLGALAWLVLSANAARAVLLREADGWAVGAAMSATCVLALAMAGAATLALVPPMARAVTARLHPAVSGACGLLAALAVGALGIHIGDTSGNGRAPLAILWVLARHELDLSPVAGLV
ncbi:MAG: hypothetical protein ACRELB_23255, partial [Polyangiaceae bacterium]